MVCNQQTAEEIQLCYLCARNDGVFAFQVLSWIGNVISILQMSYICRTKAFFGTEPACTLPQLRR